MATSFGWAQPRSSTTPRAEALLSRYPNLSEAELAELINLFPRLNMMTRGLMAADDRLGGRVEHFYQDHGQKLDPGVGGRFSLALLAALLAVSAAWWALA